MIRLLMVAPHHVDRAWKDGASSLVEACEEECTIDQLKMLCSRGERNLVRMDRDDKTVGWVVYRIDSLPNLRALHVTNLVARKAKFEEFYPQLVRLAKDTGCSQIRCSAKDAPASIYMKKLGFVPVYTTLKAEVI